MSKTQTLNYQIVRIQPTFADTKTHVGYDDDHMEHEIQEVRQDRHKLEQQVKKLKEGFKAMDKLEQQTEKLKEEMTFLKQ